MDYNSVEGIRASTLKKFTVLPGEKLSLRKAFKDKDLGRAGDLGSAVHYALEDEGEISPLVHRCPWDSYRGSDAKYWRDGIERKGEIALSQKDYTKHEDMITEIWGNCPAFAKDMIQSPNAIREEVLTADGLKAQIDLRVGGDVMDYKTTRHGDIKGITRDFFRLAYDIQAWHYRYVLLLNGITTDNFYFGFVSNTSPYETFIIRVNDDVLEFGERRWTQAMSTYLQWKDTPITDLPPMYEEVVNLSLPSWLSNSEDLSQVFKD